MAQCNLVTTALPPAHTASPRADRADAPVTLSINWVDDTHVLRNLSPATTTVRDVKQRLKNLTTLDVSRQSLYNNSVLDPSDLMTLEQLNLGSDTTLLLVDRGEDGARDNAPEVVSSEPEERPRGNMFAALGMIGVIYVGVRGNMFASFGHGNNGDAYPVDQPNLQSDSDDDAASFASYDDYEDESFPTYNEDYDMDEDIAPPSFARPTQSLIDQAAFNARDASQQFAINFNEKYAGGNPVNFREGTFTDVLTQAKQESKPLLVYIHSNISVETNVYCVASLCTPAVSSLINERFIAWGWDVTYESNRDLLTTQITHPMYGQLVRTPENCPFTAVVLNTDEDSRLFDFWKYESGEGLYEKLFELLARADPILEVQSALNRKRKEDTETRLWEQKEQNSAYEQSLEDDRAKETQRKLEELERKMKQDEEDARIAQEQAEIQKLEDAMVSEPPVDCGKPMSSIKFKCPEGEVFDRRFLMDEHRVKDLITYAGSKGYTEPDFVLATSYPRRVLNDGGRALTLREARMAQRELIHISER
ncbi:hypothetical protein SARC_02169 [Sphaeroforma arctica JP610]|uniref:UBX domain-containing protein n=1 Tax=Sphaeroforma arctica JP610 TaxID=667725 RepID=A0A0L0GBN1_9EUKA|nr:hypothetical protein SARC_02169 [Sphaeroforma arctica JP610]KNC85648.1 hypothetical protein SARC_02169 [Sphaeroforma arctica JP610]|eukprot:XP_014159550.1 hypothetical protein SARC_02169 [Sphaeroforma arctica JP610]